MPLALFLLPWLALAAPDYSDPLQMWSDDLAANKAKQLLAAKRNKAKQDLERGKAKAKAQQIQTQAVETLTRQVRRPTPPRATTTSRGSKPQPRHPAPPAPAKVFVKLVDETGKPLPAGFALRVTWNVVEQTASQPSDKGKSVNAADAVESFGRAAQSEAERRRRGEFASGPALTSDSPATESGTRTVAKWSQRLVTKKDGTLPLPVLTPRPGFLSLDLPPSSEDSWSFTDESHAALVIGESNLTAYKVKLRREVVDYSITGLPDSTSLTLPDGRVTNSTTFRLNRALATDPECFVILTSNLDGVQRMATLPLKPRREFDPYSTNLIDGRAALWRLNALIGLKHPFPALEHPVTGLGDMLNLHKLESQLGPLKKEDWALLRSPGDRAEISLDSVSMKCVARMVSVTPKSRRDPTAIPVVESLTYTDTRAGEVAGITRNDLLTKVVDRLGPGEPNERNKNLVYFDGGLVFVANRDGTRVDSIRMIRPLEFLKQGLRPAPLHTNVTIGVQLSDRVQYLSPKDENKLPSERGQRNFVQFALSLMHSFDEETDNIRLVEDPARASLVMILRDYKQHDRDTIEPLGWDLGCSLRIYDQRSDRVYEVRDAKSTKDYTLAPQSAATREYVEQDLISKIKGVFLRNSRVGRVIEVDPENGEVTVEMEHADQVRPNDVYRLRNFDQAALPRDIVACVAGDAEGRAGTVRMELWRADLSRGRVVKRKPMNLTEARGFLRRLLDPSTRLVYADYIPTLDEVTTKKAVQSAR